MILTDWGAFSNVYQSPFNLASDLIALSLLYDEILIPDEIFVLNDFLPSWFNDRDSKKLLAKILDLDSVTLLGWKSYPKDINFDHQCYPLRARAEFHSKYSTKGHDLFIPNEDQVKFYEFVEHLLLNRPSAIRNRGSRSPIDVYQEFSRILKEILSKSIYDNWLDSFFPGISSKTKYELLQFINEPLIAIDEIKKKKKNDVRTIIKNNTPIFNRSLAFQVANMYPIDTAISLERLIQSIFAIPLCESEDSIGRYGGFLREVPLHLSDTPENNNIEEEKVSVDVSVDTEIFLPDIFSDFPKIINHIRESKSGILLRQAMRNIGEDINFYNVQHCWSSVADELSRFSKTGKKKIAQNRLLRIGEKLFIGTVLGEINSIAFGNIPVPGIGSMLGVGLGLAFDHGYNIIKKEIYNQQVRREIENYVSFRCSWIPLR